MPRARTPLERGPITDHTGDASSQLSGPSSEPAWGGGGVSSPERRQGSSLGTPGRRSRQRSSPPPLKQQRHQCLPSPSTESLRVYLQIRALHTRCAPVCLQFSHFSSTPTRLTCTLVLTLVDLSRTVGQIRRKFQVFIQQVPSSTGCWLCTGDQDRRVSAFRTCDLQSHDELSVRPRPAHAATGTPVLGPWQSRHGLQTPALVRTSHLEERLDGFKSKSFLPREQSTARATVVLCRAEGPSLSRPERPAVCRW